MKTKTKSPHILERQELMAEMRRIVCYLLKYTPEQYAERQYNCGKRYLILHTCADENIRFYIESNRMFWSWWRNEWLQRDLQFANSREKGETREQMLEDYDWLHNPRVLAGSIHPNSVVLADSYAVMIGDLITKEVQHA